VREFGVFLGVVIPAVAFFVGSEQSAPPAPEVARNPLIKSVAEVTQPLASKARVEEWLEGLVVVVTWP